ncbi:MAG: diadenylate cyclase [Oscillospiraceae bacterium]|nr:diadenylate cyclase [Oscillospiraceae bacterium]
MDAKMARLFDSWQDYTVTLGKINGRVNALLTDLGVNAAEVNIISFISSKEAGELLYFDSNGETHSAQRFVASTDKSLEEERLAELFGIRREFSVFHFDVQAIQQISYDEFGMLNQEAGEVSAFGAVVQYPRLHFSRIVFELLSRIGAYYKGVLDAGKFEIESYMLAELVYVTLKSQIDIDVFNTLAASPYESRAALGGILLVDDDQPFDLDIEFTEEYLFETRNVRQIRKLLEMATGDLPLIVRGGHVIGLGSGGEYGELFVFSGHQMWSYYKEGMELLSCKEGKYTLVFGAERNYLADFPDGFFRRGYGSYLNAILREIQQQKHGALLIITDEAEAEVDRLCRLNRGYAILPIDFKQESNRMLLTSITSIDGAFFMDTDFICYGVGLILDGIAVMQGLSSRGSRYNSAKCYIDNKDAERYVSIVISEDKTTDILYNKK